MGRVRYTGNRAVLITGEHVAHISAQAVHDLLAGRAREGGFLALARDEYRSNWTDNPTQTLKLTLAGQTKTVVDYVGTEAGLPLAIRNLEYEIDEVAGTARWVKRRPAHASVSWRRRRGRLPLPIHPINVAAVCKCQSRRRMSR